MRRLQQPLRDQTPRRAGRFESWGSCTRSRWSKRGPLAALPRPGVLETNGRSALAVPRVLHARLRREHLQLGRMDLLAANRGGAVGVVVRVVVLVSVVGGLAGA